MRTRFERMTAATSAGEGPATADGCSIADLRAASVGE